MAVSIVLIGALTLVFYRSLAPTQAATSNITVINNNQTITTTQDPALTTITRTSEVNVTDTSATHGYTLTAQISANNLTGATVTIASDTSSSCPKATPCTLSSTPTPILITSNSNATGAQGETTLFEVVITIPASSNIGAYTLDIAYDETPIALPTPQWVKAADNNTNAISSITGDSATDFTVDLDTNMIPIVNKANDDTYPSSWCNYDEKQWCNAVTVKPTGGTKTLEEYKNAPAGTIIAEEDILGYWTYIPRYKYQVTRYDANNDNTNYRTQTPFNITFQKTTGPKAIPTAYTGTGDYQTNVGASNAWATHPAFTVGATELSGFWYGKFESSRSDGYYCHTYGCNGDGGTSEIGAPLNTASLYATIKPNKAPATYQRVSNAYLSAEYIDTAHNFNNQNTHMSTNNHWGATAYLSTSAYGVGDEICADTTCSTNFKKVYNNGYDNTSVTYNTNTAMRYQTGCGPVSTHSDSDSATCNSYQTEIGQQASTTGNVYGIYDMAGGTYEYQMSVLTCSTDSQLSTGYSTAYNSGFSNGTETSNNCYYNGTTSATQPTNPTAWPDNKYLNIYPRYSTFTNNNYYTNNNQCTWATCGGQALHETKTVQSVSGSSQSWGRDYSYFMYANYPWFFRGGYAGVGSGAGLFGSYYARGGASLDYGWRAVAGAY